MQCKELEAVLESEGLSPLPPEAREHLASCTSCQDLIADLSTIVVAAKHVPAEVKPPDRVWVSIRAQLEAEGIIRDTEPVLPAVSTPWWNSFADMFRPRVLATVGAGLLVVLGSIYVVEHRNSPVTVVQSPLVSVQPPPALPATPSEPSTPTFTPAPEKPVPVVVAKKTPQPAGPGPDVSPTPRPSSKPLSPSPSERVQATEPASVVDDPGNVLRQAEISISRRELANNPAVDTALRQNLRTLNEFIAECKSRLKHNPNDQLTREYLNMAYQQKAELLDAMMYSGRSEH